MHKLLKKRFITIIFLLLSFVGQSVALVISPCQKDMQDQQGEMVMGMMDHSTHSMNSNTSMDQTASKLSSEDCCNPDCLCSMASCVSATLPSTSQSVGKFLVSSHNFSQLQSVVSSQIPDSLYRPPITR